jgi:hypothetical protein
MAQIDGHTLLLLVDGAPNQNDHHLPLMQLPPPASPAAVAAALPYRRRLASFPPVSGGASLSGGARRDKTQDGNGPARPWLWTWPH